jgi:hypothetical protein
MKSIKLRFIAKSSSVENEINIKALRGEEKKLSSFEMREASEK